MSETPIGDAVAEDLGLPAEDAPEYDERSDDGTDEVPEGDDPNVDPDEPDLGEAPEVADDEAEAEEGGAEDESEEPGEAEPDDAPVKLDSPYSIPGEPAGGEE